MAKRSVKAIKTEKKNIKISEDAQHKVRLDATLVSVDDGNGKMAAYRYGDKGFSSVLIPHGRTPLSGDGFGNDVAIKGMSIPWYELPTSDDFSQAERWGYGSDIGTYTDRRVEVHQNTINRYGASLQVASVINAIDQLGCPQQIPLTLVTSAPPGLVAQVAKDIKRAFLIGFHGDRSGAWYIRPKGAKQWREYIIGKVIVMPEGLPAYAAYRFMMDGSVADLPDPNEPRRDVLSGRVEIADGGYGTFDMFPVVNGIPVTEGIEHATDADSGVQARMIRPIMDKLMEWTHATHITEAMIDTWLRTWAEGNYNADKAIVEISGQTLELHNLFYKSCQNYAQYIGDAKMDRAFGRGTNAIVAVGGGWLYIENFLRMRYPKRTIVTPSMYEHTSKIPLYSLNAYGGLIQIAQELNS